MGEHEIFGLPVSKASAWIFNCYVIHGDDGVAIVDPGLPLVAKRTLDHLARDLGRSPHDIRSVNCTHGHPDHVGGVSALAGGDAELCLPRRCEAYLAGERPRVFPLIESTVRFLPVWAEQPFEAKALGEFAKLGTRVGFGGPPDIALDFEPTAFLDDGHTLVGSPEWEVIHAPGHTDDSTCFYHRGSETLISGDAVVTVDGRAWFNPEYVDSDVAAATEERLRSLPVRHLLPGHGEPIEAADVWATALSFREPPSGAGVFARCSRRFGKWLG
ncbi:MAG: MBL fold metallo-hydrolase [Actinomycetota bacterium]